MNVKELIALADYLDEKGEISAAKDVDEMIAKAVMVEDEDDEFKKQLSEEGYSDPEVYVNKPDADSPTGDNKELESMHEQLSDAGYKVFRPGELEEWLKATGHEKIEEISDSDIVSQNVEDDEPSFSETGLSDLDLNSMHKGLSDAGYKVLTPEELDKFKSMGLDELFNDRPHTTLKESPDEQMDVDEFFNSKEDEEAEEGPIEDTFARLSDLADRLDKLGASEHADSIDAFVLKYAGDIVPDVLEWQDGDKDSERSKRYDAEYHHALQVREPKSSQERVDLEGREEHHIDTFESSKATKKEAAPHGALQTRYSPDLVGVQLARVGDGIYQCPLTKKMYDFEKGYVDMDGDYHPGSSVAAQTPDATGYNTPHRMFDSRDQVSNRG